MKKKVKLRVEDGQFDEFWELKCPHCGKPITIEIILNVLEEDEE